MNRQEHLLTIAAEECAEVAVRLSKSKRFGMHEIEPCQSLTNRERIIYELNDLLTVLAMADVIEIDHEGCVTVDAAMQGEKERKVEKYLLYSHEVGTLTGLLGYVASTGRAAALDAAPREETVQEESDGAS
jgi:hypothetical protein